VSFFLFCFNFEKAGVIVKYDVFFWGGVAG